MKYFKETTITVQGIEVVLRRKPVRTLRIVIRPPDGRVLASVPPLLDDEAVRAFIEEKLPWIRRHRERMLSRERLSAPQMASGETVPWLGQPYPLDVRLRPGSGFARFGGAGTIELYARPDSTPEQRRAVLYEWYRAQLKEMIPPLMAKWEAEIGVKAANWGVKRMKTRWGTCNVRARRIWLNLELARKPVECLEYVIVHELTHLVERSHDERFKGLMDRFLPDWRRVRETLGNALPALGGPAG